MKRESNRSARTWAVQKVVNKATKEGTLRVIAVGAKGALQIAKNEGYLDPENRSSNPKIAQAQEWAAKVEKTADPYFHVTKDAVIRTLPGGRIGRAIGRVALRRAPIPAEIREAAREVADTLFDKLDKPSPHDGLAA